MSWNLNGTYFENCNCDVICPCISSPTMGPADQDTCDVMLAYHIDDGSIEGIDVSGRDVIMIARAPAIMSSGGWKVVLVIDDKASDQEAEVLGRVFAGQAGGPPAALGALVGEVLGIERAPVSYTNDGLRHSVTAGDLVDVAIADYVPAPEQDEPMKLTGVAHPVASTLTVARAERGRVRAHGLEWDNTGKNGHAAPFSWSA